jgi:hypothetical protein
MNNHSKQTINCADNIIYHYAIFDKLSGCYALSFGLIDDFDIAALSSFILNEDEHYASEATGIDNPEYERSMLPAMIRYMRNPTQDNKIEFNGLWIKGVVSYQEHVIEDLLQDRLDVYNSDKGYVTKHPVQNSWAA